MNGDTQKGNFHIGVRPWTDGETFAVLVTERKYGVLVYVDIVDDPRFDWFGWRHNVATFETRLTVDHVVEFNDRASTTFHGIKMPLQRMPGSSVDRLIDLCEKLSKAQRKKR